MHVSETPGAIDQRVQSLIALYAASDCSVADLLCDRHPGDSLAYRIVNDDGTTEDLTYGKLKADSERFASALSGLGVSPGDRVATLMGKSRDYLVALMGIWRLGAVHVPLFTAFAPPAIMMRLASSNAKFVITDPTQQAKLDSVEQAGGSCAWRVISTDTGSSENLGFHDLLAQAEPGFPAAQMGGGAPLIHIFTSGTTGTPKGVVVPARALAAIHVYSEFALAIGPDDFYWCAADPGWAYGLYYGILGSLASGVPSLMVAGSFSPERTLDLLATQHVTNFAAAPTVYRAMRNANIVAPAGLALRHASSAGEPLTPEVNDWAQTALGVAVHDHYGQTEAGMLINNHHHPLLARPLMPGSMGRAMPGWKAVVLHEDRNEEAPANTLGRVAIDLEHSPLAWFSGYDGDPTKSAERFAGNGRWYLTGDAGTVDEEGNFRFSSRADDVILMAGYRIGPSEVEAVLIAHPAIAEAAVIAVPDEIRGEVLEAYVVLRDGQKESEGLVGELQQWVKTHYAAHAFPRDVHFASSLPRTESGKLKRFVLTERRRAGLENARI